MYTGKLKGDLSGRYSVENDYAHGRELMDV
jgi:hypothetical protein